MKNVCIGCKNKFEDKYFYSEHDKCPYCVNYKENSKLDKNKLISFIKFMIEEYKSSSSYAKGDLFICNIKYYPFMDFSIFKDIETRFNKVIFTNDIVLFSDINNYVEFIDCEFHSNFVVCQNRNGDYDNELVIKKSVFYNENFKFDLSSANFKKYIDLRENTFYSEVELDTSFEDNVFFDKCTFYKKLNLENTIFYHNVSFQNIKLLGSVKNRETARILKDSFDQKNNIIEANKFYALEMEEREKELNQERKEGKNFLDWIIFKIHKHSSNHSQDWSLALFWIMIIGFISSYCDFNFAKVNETHIHFDILNIFKTLGLVSLMFILSYICEVKDKIVNGVYYLVCTYLIYIYSTEDYLLTLFAKVVNPTTVLKSNDPINGIQLLFKIIIAYLIYQLVVSIRQNTRRK